MISGDSPSMDVGETAKEYIEFLIHDEQRFATLLKVFEALKAAKEGYGSAPEPEDPYWRSFFDEEALSHFWHPTEELQEHLQRWFATPVEERFRLDACITNGRQMDAEVS